MKIKKILLIGTALLTLTSLAFSELNNGLLKTEVWAGNSDKTSYKIICDDISRNISNASGNIKFDAVGFCNMLQIADAKTGKNLFATSVQGDTVSKLNHCNVQGKTNTMRYVIEDDDKGDILGLPDACITTP